METEEERQIRWKERIEMMKKEKRRRELMFRWGIPAMALTALLAGVGIGFGAGAFSDRRSRHGTEEN